LNLWLIHVQFLLFAQGRGMTEESASWEEEALKKKMALVSRRLMHMARINASWASARIDAEPAQPLWNVTLGHAEACSDALPLVRCRLPAAALASQHDAVC
jgi:hypothetical protein